MAKVIQLMETEERIGAGRDGDPVRLVYQLWTLDGQLVMERDPWLIDCDRRKKCDPNAHERKPTE